MAAGVRHQSAAKQPLVNTSAPASSTVDMLKHGVTAADPYRDLHSMALGGNVADLKSVGTPPPADPPQDDEVVTITAADAVCISGEATAAESGSALGSPEAVAAEADLAHDNQKAAAGEAEAATMAAWLIQKPSLLQGVLGHLESLAASAMGKNSILPPLSDLPAGLLASRSLADKFSVVSAYSILFLLQRDLLSLSAIPESEAELRVDKTAGWHRWGPEWQGV